MTPETIIIKSDYDEDVTYVIHPHGADEGFDLAPKIMTLMSAPVNVIAMLAKSMATGKAAEGEDLADTVASAADGNPATLAADIEMALRGVDGEKMGAAIREFGSAILTAGGHRMCMQILKYTAATTPDGVSLKVGDLAGFKRRYGANYGELFFALFHAIRINFGPMIARLLKGQDPLGALGGLARRTRK